MHDNWSRSTTNVRDEPPFKTYTPASPPTYTSTSALSQESLSTNTRVERYAGVHFPASHCYRRHLWCSFGACPDSPANPWDRYRQTYSDQRVGALTLLWYKLQMSANSAAAFCTLPICIRTRTTLLVHRSQSLVTGKSQRRRITEQDITELLSREFSLLSTQFLALTRKYRECDSPLRLTNFTLDYLEKHWSSEIDFVICMLLPSWFARIFLNPIYRDWRQC